jgi:RimJ/RimL family protein N-acetyltransferase
MLVTERLELWQPCLGDIAQMMAIVAHPDTARFLGSAQSPADHFTRFQLNAGSWFLHGYGGFIVRLKGKAPVIGNCGVFHSFRGLGEDFDDQAEAGWIVAADQAGQGIAGEAMRAALDWFDRTHGPRRTVCMIDADNAPSIRLAEKLGFAPMRRVEFNGELAQLFVRLP